ALLFSVTWPSTMRGTVTPLTVVCSPELQRPPMATTPEHPTMSFTSPKGSSNWIVLTPSQMPPATERAGTVADPAPSTIEADATFVQAANALPTTASVVAAP